MGRLAFFCHTTWQPGAALLMTTLETPSCIFKLLYFCINILAIFFLSLSAEHLRPSFFLESVFLRYSFSKNGNISLSLLETLTLMKYKLSNSEQLVCSSVIESLSIHHKVSTPHAQLTAARFVNSVFVTIPVTSCC